MIAIDVEMPKSCADCERGSICGYGLGYSRASDCPLKEIVTCKECKHLDGLYICEKLLLTMDDDCFCCFGERRE